MAEFYPTIKNGVLQYSPVQLGMRERWLRSLKDGAKVKEVLTRQCRMKTHQQVKAHFGLVVELIRQRFIDMGIDVCGIPPNKEMVHAILKKACGGVGDMGETLGLSEMTATQASKFFDNCRMWAATQLSLNIPDPDPNWQSKQKTYANSNSQKNS
jgi:hypothetical protein